MLSKKRSKTAATRFFARALEVNDLPQKICHRQKRSQYLRHYRDHPDAEALRLPDPDRVSEQHD